MVNKHFDFIVQPYINEKDATYIEIINIPNSIIKEISVLRKFFERKFKSLPNICRVDFIKNGLYYEILEIELIDPDLYFKYIPQDLKDKSVSILCDII